MIAHNMKYSVVVCLLMWLYSGSIIIAILDILPYSRRNLSLREYLPNKHRLKHYIVHPSSR
jgi:hypothetical protein